MNKSLGGYFFMVFIFLSTGICAQQEDYIFGQLVDVTKNDPIPFASIRIKDKPLGVISNVDGTFKIPIRYKTLGDAIEISCMGYESKEISIQDLKEGESNIITLKPSAFELTEAIVSANIDRLSAKQIVRIAVNSIAQNYPLNEFRLTGYYRDYQVRNGNYTNLNEAIIKIEDQGFSAKSILKNRYQLYSYKPNFDFEVDSFARQPYDYRENNKIVPDAKMFNDGGNEFVLLRMHDAIRNYGLESFSFIDDLSSDFIDNHRFRLKGKTNFDEEAVYEIDMVFRNKDYLANGKIYINTDDFAIHKLDYAVFKRKKPQDISVAINEEERFSDGFQKTNREMLYHIQTEYVRGTENKMFLNYISFYNKVLVHRPASFKSKFVINLNDRSFRIRLNKIPFNLDKIKEKDFKITYKDDFVPIKEFYFLEDERTFVVCPHLGYNRAEHIFKGLFLERKDLQVSDVKYSYGNIKDELGNILDERKWEYLHQYREFFVQRVNLDSVKSIDVFMDKEKPIFKNQTIVEPENFNDFWMNTPLRSQ